MIKRYEVDTPNKLIACPEPGILFTRANAAWAYHALKAVREAGQSIPEQDELCDELCLILFPDRPVMTNSVYPIPENTGNAECASCGTTDGPDRRARWESGDKDLENWRTCVRCGAMLCDSCDLAGASHDCQDDDDEDEDDSPHDGDGYVILDTGPGGRIDYEVRLEGICKGRFPAGDIAVYELARAMAEAGSFPAAWMEGEHGPSSRSIDAEVRKYHDIELGEILLPLPGARFAPGDDVTDSDGGWSCTVIRDYGDLGVHVHAQGDPSVTAVVPPARLSRETETCGSCGLPVIRQDTGLLEDPDYGASSDEARYCDAAPDFLHHPEG